MPQHAGEDGSREAWIEDNQVRVALPGKPDLAGLSRDLRHQGYFLANDPEDMDSQGWGKDRDLEGYYPYWVFRNGEQWVFAFSPEDYRGGSEGERRPEVGEDTRKEIERWVPYLKRWTDA